jgi:ketosteroid isomerase-like protein
MEGRELVGGTVEALGDPASVAASGPEAAARSFARALLARDPRAAAAHLSPDACLVTPDGTELSGREAIAALLAQITSSERVLEIGAGRTVAAAAGALASQRWRWGEGGATTTAHLVLAREEDGWRIVVACPWD